MRHPLFFQQLQMQQDLAKRQLADLLGFTPDEPIPISAKAGTGVTEVLEAVVQRIPPPAGDPEAPLKALVFDSFYDSYQGVVVYVRVVDGRVTPGTKVLLMSTDKVYEVQQVGVFTPQMVRVDALSAGQVGFLTASIKRVADSRIGETITEAANPEGEEYGLERLERTVRRHLDGPLDGVLEGLEQDLEGFVRGVPYGDDRTILVLRRAG